MSQWFSNRGPRTSARASPGNLLEIFIFKPCPESTESECLVFNKPSRWIRCTLKFKDDHFSPWTINQTKHCINSMSLGKKCHAHFTGWLCSKWGITIVSPLASLSQKPSSCPYRTPRKLYPLNQSTIFPPNKKGTCQTWMPVGANRFGSEVALDWI